VTTKNSCHPFRRSVQFNTRPSPRFRDRVDDCQWSSRGQSPCGRCDACEYEQAVHRIDHPVRIPAREIGRL
jgi:hypothetical protein